MATYCLIKPLAEKFKKAIKDGEINPEELALMSSAARREIFAKIIGDDNAIKVNELFESKLLLKDTQQGMINWAKQVTGIKPEVRRDLISRIQKMDEKILNPENEQKFLQDLANKRLNTEVTLEEAKKITELSQKLLETKQNTGVDRLAYGRARVAMENYINDIKRENNKITLEKAKEKPLSTAIESASFVAGFAKSMKATLDMSALLRQGGRALVTHPSQWIESAAHSFKNTWNTLLKKTSDDSIMNGIKAEIYSRPNAMDGTYQRMGLDIGTGEEAYPNSLPEKIPAIGRVFKASEIAYNGFLMELRANVADEYIKLAEKVGEDIKDTKKARAIGQLVNSLTGRGNLGSFENAGKTINTVFFSPKSLKAQVDFLTAHVFEGEQSTPFVRKQAAINLLKVIGVLAAILAIAKALISDSVEQDPRSSDFGKIKINDTRFDISGGLSSLVVLASRLISQSSKSSISGKISQLGNKIGETTGVDLLVNFAENKLAPVAAVLRDILKGKTTQNTPVTVPNETSNLLMPLPITNVQELLNDPYSAPLLIAMIADALGIATNTYAETNIKTDIIPTGKNIKNDDFISMVSLYAKAIGTDPETAFNRIFTGQRIRRVDNDTIIVERMPLLESEKVKKKYRANNPTMKLDHTIPLELGGSNDESNLKVVPTSEWSSYTPVENKLGQLLRANKITKKEAQDLIVRFKNHEIKKEEIMNRQ